MEIKEIKKIIKDFEKSSLMMLELEYEGFKLKLSKASPLQEKSEIPNYPLPKEGGTIVKSPLVGTFYLTGGLNETPFVKEGDVVEPGQVLCMVEAMKTMNEIQSPIHATVKCILVNNKQAVGYHQNLMELTPYDE